MNSKELIVDSFAGGGGASLGIAWALGRAPDIAINHDESAIEMHAANHPSTEHVLEDVWKADLRKLVGRTRICSLERKLVKWHESAIQFVRTLPPRSSKPTARREF